MKSLPIRLGIGLLAAAIAYYTPYAAVFWWCAFIVLVTIRPGRMAVQVDDHEWEQLALDFREALLEGEGSLKAAAIAMKLGPSDLTHALAREAKVDLFARSLLLSLDTQRLYHLKRLVSLGLPEKTQRMLKIAAAIQPYAEKEIA